VPRVAESYETNADASEFTFHIRQGVTWSDGTPLNAHDFEYSWKRVLDPETLSEYTSALDLIKNAAAIAEKAATEEWDPAELDTLGVKATDDYTLVVTLEGSATFFPLLAATWTFYPVPRHVIENKGLEWTEAGNLVSNGPFTMTEWSHDQQIVLEANPSYYGEKPTLTKATWTVFSDEAVQAYVAYAANELDYCAPEGPDLDAILASPDLMQEALQFQRSNCFFVVADTTNTPTDVPDFRKALYKALDRKTLAETIFNNQYEAAYTILPDNIPGHNPDAALPESVDEAKALLTGAGIDPASVSLELTYTNTSFYKTVAEYLQSAWQQGLGISITLAPIEDSAYSDWRASRETQPFNVYTGSWGSDFADASNWFNQNFTHANDHYRNHWNYPDFDTLVEAAVSNTNAEERNAQYSQAETIIVDQAPIIPLLRSKAFRMIKPWVKDLYFQPILSSVHLRTIKIAAH
jgi:oligopeptide transport system substrate-binding protein